MKKKDTTNLVKIHNDVNRVAFTGFNKLELSIFYSLAKIVDDKEDEELFIPFSDLRKMMPALSFSNRTKFLEVLNETVKKLLSMQATIKKPDGDIIYFVPFIVFEVKQSKGLLRIRVNPEYKYLFNMLTQNFTQFELSVFYNLKTKYAQRLFSLLMQFKTTGKLIISVEDFARVMDAPESYTTQKIGAKILTPAVEHLKEYFPGLKVKKIKEGRAIKTYEFTFRAENLIENDSDQEKKETSDPKAEANDTSCSDPILCPHCGKEMVLRTNKGNGTAFYGHKYYKNTDCKVTYASLEELETDRMKIQKEKEEKAKAKSKADSAWENVVKQQQSLFDTLKKNKE